MDRRLTRTVNRTVAFTAGLLVAVSFSLNAATFNLFQPASGILVGDPNTYVTTSAASSDVTALWTGACDTTTFLRGDGLCVAPPAGGVPGGANTQVQYNDSGSFGGDVGLTYDSGTGTLTATNLAGAGTALSSLNATNVTAGTLADARLSSNVPLLNAANIFTANADFNASVTIESAIPTLIWEETDAGLDEKVWYGRANSDEWTLETRTDIGGVGATAIRASRTGTTVDTVNLQATDVQANGATAWHDIDSAGNGGGPLGIAYVATNALGTALESFNVASVVNDAVGQWTITFTANTFNQRPVCVANYLGEGIAFQLLTGWTATTISMETRDLTTGALENGPFTLHCQSTAS